MSPILRAGAAFSVIFAATIGLADEPPGAAPPTFEKDIRPILARACFACHGQETQEAQLDLRTLSEILRGGENGPAVVRGEPHNSLLLDLVATSQMPPGDEEKLTAEEVAALRSWIEAGVPADERVVHLPPRMQVTAEDRSFWAFQPPKKRAVPRVQDGDRVQTPIDAFLLAKLEAQGLGFSPEAGRSVLIRRAYFDLIGLPPEPAAVKAFEEDLRPQAYERLIEELLASPQYGERWGRHWLDAAGYVDNRLFDGDLGTIYPNEGIWRYRDYVIGAFNQDKPFDRFLTEQLAGDELTDWRAATSFDPQTVSLLTATGFLRSIEDPTSEPQYGIEKRYEVVNGVMDMFSTAILGLTLECCRCHNHKYDPLPQRDYYRLMACFEPALNPHNWKRPQERFLADVSPQERAAIDQRNAELEQQVAELKKSEGQLRQQVGQRVQESRWNALPEEIRADVRQALELKPEERSEAQRALAARHEAEFNLSEADIDAALSEADKAVLRANAEQRAALSSQKRSYGVIQALWDVGAPPASHIHRRGNVKALGVLVQPGFPEILQPAAAPAGESFAESRGETSGRRLALARWLIQPEHPLTSRVYVNRVWHHHFGRGIVETLGNFGRSGSLPTHPELLDWLALDFITHGWSTKRLHRQIMLSSAYRQSARRPEHGAVEPAASAERIDPDNRLLWRMNLRRLEAEILRDAILSVSGALDRTAGGPPVEITNPADGLSEPKAAPTPTSPHRRSVYLFARRVYPLKFLEIFDAPIMPVNCTQRMNSATVLQSLALLHGEFLFAEADRMAQRLAGASTETPARIDLAFRIAFARPPTDTERAKASAFLAEQAAGYEADQAPADQTRRRAFADLCQMLLSSNEFLYVE